MPRTGVSFTSAGSQTRISQVDVPMMRVSTLGAIEAPTAPTWASIDPTPTFVSAGIPSRSANAGAIVPAQASAVKVSA